MTTKSKEKAGTHQKSGNHRSPRTAHKKKVKRGSYVKNQPKSRQSQTSPTAQSSEFIRNPEYEKVACTVMAQYPVYARQHFDNVMQKGKYFFALKLKLKDKFGHGSWLAFWTYMERLQEWTGKRLLPCKKRHAENYISVWTIPYLRDLYENATEANTQSIACLPEGITMLQKFSRISSDEFQELIQSRSLRADMKKSELSALMRAERNGCADIHGRLSVSRRSSAKQGDYRVFTEVEVSPTFVDATRPAVLALYKERLEKSLRVDDFGAEVEAVYGLVLELAKQETRIAA